MQMLYDLSAIETRVLGALIEKSLATPEYYPMSLNALVNACNQKTNRDPVTEYGEDETMAALESMRAKGLTVRVTGGGGRVPRHRHTLGEGGMFSREELAVLAALMLRGAQTLGEIRVRTERMARFEGLDAVQRTVDGLIDRDVPMALQQERQPGQKEARFAHLLGEGEVLDSAEAQRGGSCADGELSASRPTDRIGELEREVESLRGELNNLRVRFESFVKQFE